MSKPALLLIGAGGHAKSCIDVIEQEDKFQIIGLVGSPNDVGAHVLGYEVLGTDDALSELLNMTQYALVAVGQIGTNDLRSKLFSEIINIGFLSPIVMAIIALSIHMP